LTQPQRKYHWDTILNSTVPDHGENFLRV
jgi:hypothetical protein